MEHLVHRQPSRALHLLSTLFSTSLPSLRLLLLFRLLFHLRWSDRRYWPLPSLRRKILSSQPTPDRHPSTHFCLSGVTMSCKAYVACLVTTAVVLLIGGVALWFAVKPASSPPPMPPPPTLPPPVFASLPDLSLSSTNDSQAQPCDLNLEVEEKYAPNVESKQINSESILTIVNSADSQAGQQVTSIHHLVSAKVAVGLVAVLAFLACLHTCFVNVLHHRTIAHSRAVMATMWGGQDPPPPPSGAHHSSWGARLRTICGLRQNTSSPIHPAPRLEEHASLEMQEMAPTSSVPSNSLPQSGSDLAFHRQPDLSPPVLDPLGGGSVAVADRPGRPPLAGVLSDTRGIRAVLKLYLSSFTDLNHHPISLRQACVFPIGFTHHSAALILFTLSRTRGLAMAFNSAASAWKVPSFKMVAGNMLPLLVEGASYDAADSYTTFFVSEVGVMSWRPTLAQLNELVNPILNWIHSKRLAEKGQTRDIFPMVSGLSFHPPARQQRIVEDVQFSSDAHKILVRKALSELVPVLNCPAPCTPLQWSSLRQPGFAMKTGIKYGHPLEASESSPPLPRLPPPQQSSSSDSDSEEEDPVALCSDTSEPLDCDCSPALARRDHPLRADTPPPQHDTEFLHQFHGLLINDVGDEVQEVSSLGLALTLHKPLPVPDRSASLAAPFAVPLVDIGAVGDVSCLEVVHQLSQDGKPIHSWCLESTLSPALRPHPLDDTVIVALSQPAKARKSFQRKVLGVWTRFPPMASGGILHWRLPPQGVPTFRDNRVTLSANEVSDTYFSPVVVYADGTSSRDSAAYLAALGFSQHAINRLGLCDQQTLHSLYRQVLAHDGQGYLEVVRQLIFADTHPTLAHPPFDSLLNGSRFSQWALPSEEDMEEDSEEDSDSPLDSGADSEVDAAEDDSSLPSMEPMGFATSV